MKPFSDPKKQLIKSEKGFFIVVKKQKQLLSFRSFLKIKIWGGGRLRNLDL